jgi:hypothetical protein
MVAHDPEKQRWVEVLILWAISALHWANDNLPSIIGWLTAFYTVLQIGLAIKKYFDKPAT